MEALRLPGPRQPALALAAALVLASLCTHPQAQGLPGRGTVEARLSQEELGFRLRLSRPGAAASLGFDAGGEGREIDGCLSLASPGGAWMLAGPGSAAGPARLLVDPCSPTALADSPPVELDPSLESRTRVAALGAGTCSLFALRAGRLAGRSTEEAALGLSLGRSGPAGGLCALGAAYWEGRAAPASGWQPDPAASPLSTSADCRAPCLGAAVLASRRRGGSSSLAALAGTWGRVSGPALAIRLEAGELLGPLRLRLAAGASGSGFRELAGPRQTRRLSASAEARLALRRASTLGLSLETEARGESLLCAPLWGREAALQLRLPLAEGSSLVETGFAVSEPAGGEAGASLSLALLRKADASAEAGVPAPGSSSSSRLGAVLRWEGVISGLELELSTRLCGAGGTPSLGLELSLDLLKGGSLDAPVLASGGLSTELPCGSAATLLLGASLPEGGCQLGPAAGAAGAERGGPVFTLRYRASLSGAPATSRPRSRISAQGKASSMPRRAAS